jgi:hypothetical protein
MSTRISYKDFQFTATSIMQCAANILTVRVFQITHNLSEDKL